MRASLSIIVASVIIGIAGSAAADPAPRFVESAKVTDDIKRGVEDALRCALQYAGPEEISGCTYNMARLNAQDGQDARAYNLGLTFETWRDLDVDWVSDQKLPKTEQVPALQLQDEEAGAKSMYQLYRGARDALGLTDDHVLALMTKLSPAGKSAALSRLHFWATHPH